MSYYVSPEQVMKDRAEYAQKGIARGRALVACAYDNGILFVTENTSSTLHKISEVYDRIAFAGIGKFNEFQNLRNAGVRIADVKGYTYSRGDVTASEITNIYSQTLGQIFTNEMKPYEVEILVAELAEEKDGENNLFKITFDGTVFDKEGYTVLGGADDSIETALAKAYKPNMKLNKALSIALKALDTKNKAPKLEVAVLERSKRTRCFRRLENAEITELIKK
jgi:proteasome alpha subunit